MGCRAWILGKWMEPKKIQAPAWWTTKFLAVFFFNGMSNDVYRISIEFDVFLKGFPLNLLGYLWDFMGFPWDFYGI